MAALASEALGNLIFGEGPLWNSNYKQGDLSKRIMAAKQRYFSAYGNQAQEEVLRTAPDFQAAWRSLSAAPRGTSGQVQFGIGKEYAGETLVGQGGTTQTPGWAAIIQGISDPVTVRDHPDLVAGAVANLWVQTGQGGATTFNGPATRDYQTYLLSKLPYTPEYLAAKQKILNSDPIDPRDKAGTDSTPEMPVEPGFLHVNGLRIPTDHQYKWYDGAGGKWYDYAPERVAQVATPWNASNIMDTTTGKWIGAGGEPRAELDPAYLDAQAMQTPWFKAKAKAQYDEWQARVPADAGSYNPIDMGAFGHLAAFLGVAPPAVPAAASTMDVGGGGAKKGGYIDAPPDQPVPITVHGGEYVVPRSPLAEGLRHVERTSGRTPRELAGATQSRGITR